MGVGLRAWLEGDCTLTTFLHTHLGRQPLARAGAASEAASRFTWRELEEMLSHRDLDTLVVNRGRECSSVAPRNGPELRALFAGGEGLVVRRAERHPSVRALADAVATDLPGEIHVQLFATPASGQSFGWHYDDEEVFIVQTEGCKTFYFRANSVVRDLGTPDFARVREETSPVMACTLEVGDWLYLPRGWWHAARAEADSLHLSIGVKPAP